MYRRLDPTHPPPRCVRTKWKAPFLNLAEKGSIFLIPFLALMFTSWEKGVYIVAMFKIEDGVRTGNLHESSKHIFNWKKSAFCKKKTKKKQKKTKNDYTFPLLDGDGMPLHVPILPVVAGSRGPTDAAFCPPPLW